MRLRPLTECSARALHPLLEEECRHWREELAWDFREVSSAVAGGLERGALSGSVIENGAVPVAYCYALAESGRVVVGSLFAARAFRGRGLEERLVEAVLAEAQARADSERVECQTLFSTACRSEAAFARAGFTSRGRHYLARALDLSLEAPEPGLDLRRLRRDDLAAAALVIHRSHQGSVDAALNLTYGTPALCRNFVETLVLRSGCGHFEPEASFVADGPRGIVGVLLASRLSDTNGHICQVSVLREAQARGVGTALVRAALQALKRRGLRTATLSVTVDNESAYRLYRRLGFRLQKAFTAHAWVRPPARLELPA